MLTLTNDQRTALGKRHLMRRVFIWCDAVDENGDPDPAGFWDDVGDIEHNGRTYAGSGIVVRIEKIAAKSDLTIPGMRISLCGLDDEAIDLVRARLRGQEPITVHVGLFDVADRTLIGSLVPVFVGYIDDIEFPTPAAGEDSIIDLICESTSRALTVKSTDTRSDPTLKRRRSTDIFYKYTGIQREKPIYFGRAAP